MCQWLLKLLSLWYLTNVFMNMYASMNMFMLYRGLYIGSFGITLVKERTAWPVFHKCSVRKHCQCWQRCPEALMNE
jgi:hypothetical protein